MTPKIFGGRRRQTWQDSSCVATRGGANASPGIRARRQHLYVVGESAHRRSPRKPCKPNQGRLGVRHAGPGIEFAAEGIRSNAIAPGVVNTPMNPVEAHEFLRQLSPLKRLAEVGEVADLLLYLDSAQFVNGEVVHLMEGHMLASGNAR
jgi:hypothetical protein